jgi:hypothetical protein
MAERNAELHEVVEEQAQRLDAGEILGLPEETDKK